MVSINTNLSSLLVQNNLAQSTNGLSKAIERLTTGYKINHASDNAAGYSIVQNMTSKISSYSVAEENASMGLDLLQTANGSMDLIQEHLVRIRNLAEQAANGTYGEQSLAAIQAEVDARMAEINRIVGNTEYNGIQLFNNVEEGGAEEYAFINPVTRLTEEEAIAQGYTIIKTADELQAMQDDLDGKYILMNDIDLEGYDWNPIGEWDMDDYSLSFSGEFNGNGHIIKNLRIDLSDTDAVGLFGSTMCANIKNVGIINAEITNTTTEGYGKSTGILVGRFDGSYPDNGGSITNCYTDGIVNGTEAVGGIAGILYIGEISNCYSSGTIEGISFVGGLVGSCCDVVNGANNCYSNANVSGNSFVGGTFGEYVYSVACSNIYSTGNVSGTTNVGGVFGDYNSNTGDADNCYYTGNVENATKGTEYEVTEEELEELIANGTLKRAVAPEVEPVVKPLTFQVGVFGDESSQIALDTSYAFNLAVDVSSHESAISALAAIDSQLSLVSEKQTSFGAAQNRLESVLESISTACENLVSSRSTIQDADIAQVSSDYIKKQIIQQASATLLATANQSPSIALQLL